MTHRTQTHEELVRFRAAMDMSGDTIYLVDRRAMRFVDVNLTACTRMGYSREELLQMGPQDLLAASRAEIEQVYDAVIAAGTEGMTSESTARRKDGTESTTELHRRALRVDGDWIIVSIARDITLRRQTEQALRESEERFRLTFELAGSGIAHVDLEGRFLRVNRRLCEILGYAEKALIGRAVKELSHPEDRDASDVGRLRVRAGELQSTRLEKRYVRSDGAIVWVDLTVALARDTDGNPLYDIAVFDDNTERRIAEAARRESAEKLRVFADNIPAMTASWDENQVCSFANKAYGAYYGFPGESVVGMHLREVVGAEAYRAIKDSLAQVLQGHAVTYERILNVGGRGSRYIEVRLLPHVGGRGQGPGFISVTTDITEHKLAEARVQHVAHHDSLTGLPNRALFNDRLDQAIREARRGSRKFALLYLDLNKFKPVNDTLGHVAGDELLQAVATRLRAQVRESDTVARIGGDEFAMILPGIVRREEAEIVARKLVAALVAPFKLVGATQSVNIGISVGIAIFPEDAADADALVKVADAAMYETKRAADVVG